MEPMASSKKSETEGLDVTSFMSNSSMSSSVSVTINDLPPEVLEKIIDRLDDRASVLNCRLVNSEWKAAAGKAMENLCLSGWTRWDPRGIIKEAPFPKIGSTPILPFPTRSLCLDYLGWEEYKKTNKAAKIETLQLLKLFGSHLTSLWLQRIPLDRVQISIMFKELLNLKALTIIESQRKRKWDTTVELTAKPPPNLQYLRLKWVSIHLAQWIVDQCASQLISLEAVMPFHYVRKGQPRRFLKLPSSSGTNHLRFTKLKLCALNSDIFEHTVRLPLTHLAIDFPYDFSPRQITLKDIITFLNNFSGTLVQLYLNVLLELREDEGIARFNEFPCLTELFIELHLARDPDNKRWTYIREVFLKRFPNLERLHWLNDEYFGYLGEHVEMDQVREEFDSRILILIQRCFQLCQKLETVTANLHVVDGDRDNLQRQNYEVTISRDGDQLWKQRE